MIVSDFLDSIEGTEQESIFLNNFVELVEDKDVIKLLNSPFIGKLLSVLVALGRSESIEAFRETEHYNNIKDWGIKVFDLEKGYISIHPGPKHLKRLLAALAIAGTGLLLMKIIRKYKLGLKG